MANQRQVKRTEGKENSVIEEKGELRGAVIKSPSEETGSLR